MQKWPTIEMTKRLTDKPLKLNLGCGSHCVDGWVNVDNSLNAKLSRYPFVRFALWKLGVISKTSYERVFDLKKIFFFDISKRFPYAADSIDFIYSSHTFEHLFLEKALNTAKECFRVLKPCGVCRIVVPDLFQPAKKYIEDFLSLMPNAEIGIFERKPEVDINNLYHTKGKLFDHKYLYDFISLGILFQKAGFLNIRKASALDSVIPDIEDIETRRDNSINLYMEFIKHN